MGADQHLDLALTELGEHLLHLGRPAEARDHLDPYREVAVAVAERVPVLLGEDRGRDEHQHLLAGHRDRERRSEGDLGLAVPDIAADEPVHRARRLEILFDRLDRACLILRLAVGELRLEPLEPFLVEVVGDADPRLALGVELQQLPRHLAQVGAGAVLEVVPGLAAELGERRRVRVGADVAGDLADLLVWHEDAVVAAEAEQQVVARDACDLLRLEAEQLRDAVVLVDDVVARAQVGEARERAAGGGGRPRRAAAEDLRIGEERDPELTPDEAPARGATAKERPARLIARARAVSPRRGSAAGVGARPRRDARTPRRCRAPGAAARRARSRPPRARARRAPGAARRTRTAAPAGGSRARSCPRAPARRARSRARPLAPRPAARRNRAGGRGSGRGRRGSRSGPRRPGSVISRRSAEPLGRRVDGDLVDLAERALGEGREGADALDLVPEQLDPVGLAAGGREDVDQPAADRRSGPAPRRARPARSLPARAPPRARRSPAPLRAPRAAGEGRAAGGGTGSASASAEAQTRPPRASTSSARARSPTRCGGGSSPEPSRTPREGSSATCSSPRNHPAASAASRASVSSGRSTQSAALELLVQRREQEREPRLGDTGACGQRGGKRRQALVGAQALEQRVEDRPVHDECPERQFRGRFIVAVAGCSDPDAESPPQPVSPLKSATNQGSPRLGRCARGGRASAPARRRGGERRRSSTCTTARSGSRPARRCRCAGRG